MTTHGWVVLERVVRCSRQCLAMAGARLPCQVASKLWAGIVWILPCVLWCCALIGACAMPI